MVNANVENLGKFKKHNENPSGSNFKVRRGMNCNMVFEEQNSGVPDVPG